MQADSVKYDIYLIYDSKGIRNLFTLIGKKMRHKEMSENKVKVAVKPGRI